MSTSTSVHRPDLAANVSSLSYNFELRAGSLFMPDGCTVDVDGLVAMFTALDRNVVTISTFAGTKHTTYHRTPTGWTACR
jgi:hypothetical protein